MHAPTAPAGGADRFMWVFLVPALNEQLTIRDSVDRLLAMEVVRQGTGVIGDDVTTQILVEFAHPDLVVLRRDRPAVTAMSGAGACAPARTGGRVHRHSVAGRLLRHASRPRRRRPI